MRCLRTEAVGDRLSSGPQHKGRGHVVALLSSQPIFLAEARDLRQDAEANSELMLVLEHAGQPLESIRLESLDLPSRCDIINQLLHAAPRLQHQMLGACCHKCLGEAPAPQWNNPCRHLCWQLLSGCRRSCSAGRCLEELRLLRGPQKSGRVPLSLALPPLSLPVLSISLPLPRPEDFGNSLLVSTAQRAAACQPLERFRRRDALEHVITSKGNIGSIVTIMVITK